MNAEDSYESAVRRLRRLGHAGPDLASSMIAGQAEEKQERMRDLEELATLACDENDRLTRELDSARHEIDRLHRMVTTLQETLTSGQASQPFVKPKRRGHGWAWLIAALAIGGGGAVSFKLHPWKDHGLFPPALAPIVPTDTTATTTVATTPPSVPAVTTPEPAQPSPPATEPTTPKAETTIPKVQPVIATPLTKDQRHAAKQHHVVKGVHHRHKHHGATHGDEREVPSASGDDPLAGLSQGT
jgi:hypothetical protein